MAKRESAGILPYRWLQQELQFFLVHHGGPFWAGKEAGAWSICKGELAEGEEPLQAAIREFNEETGHEIKGPFMELTPVVQKGGKKVYAWATEQEIDADSIQCNTFTMQWPPRSGQWQSFPEVDKAAWFHVAEAKEKINAAQVLFIEEAVNRLME